MISPFIVSVSRAPLQNSHFALGFGPHFAPRLYRTVSGMMNYGKAIKLLYRVENPEVVQTFGGNTEKLERELESMARRKFKFIVSMQRYSKFNKEEHENAEFLLRAYPELQIAYLEEEPAKKEGDQSSGSNFLVTLSLETENRTIRITLSSSTVVNIFS